MHKIYVDLGFGDSGKGVTVARAAAQNPNAVIVKYTGGAQCAHNVVDGNRHHTFSQFGSTFSGNHTILGKHFLVDFPALEREAKALNYPSISISSECRVITGPMIYANRLDAVRSGHGSTRRGINTTVEYDLKFGALRAGDLNDLEAIESKLVEQYAWFAVEYGINFGMDSVATEALELFFLGRSFDIRPEAELVTGGPYIFEGSQGVLLDEHVGFFPHVTRAITTTDHAIEFLNTYSLGDYETFGIIRTYMTRHGNGPMPTETELGINDGDHNTLNFAGNFRRGYLDVEAIKYAISHQPINGLVITHADFQLPMAHTQPYKTVHRYDFAGRTEYTQSLGNDYALGDIATPTNIAREIAPVVQVGYGQDIGDYESY